MRLEGRGMLGVASDLLFGLAHGQGEGIRCLAALRLPRRRNQLAENLRNGFRPEIPKLAYRCRQCAPEGGGHR